MAVSASESFNPYSALRIGPEEADPFPGERQNDVYHKDVAIPKESDLGQVGLQRRQICPRSASFSMVDGKWLSGRSLGNWQFLSTARYGARTGCVKRSVFGQNARYTSRGQK